MGRFQLGHGPCSQPRAGRGKSSTPRALLRHPGLSMAGAGPGSAAAFGVFPNPPSSLTSGRTASSCKKPGCRSPGKVGEKATDRDVRGRVQRENPTKCKKIRLGRQEPLCRVKCVCPGLGERRRSVPGSGGHGWDPAPLTARGSITSLPACLPSLRLSWPISWAGEAHVLEPGHCPAGAGGEEPQRGRRRGSTAGGRANHQPRATGAGAVARAEQVLWANVWRRLGMGKVRLWGQ